jgi:hypothetical protein
MRVTKISLGSVIAIYLFDLWKVILIAMDIGTSYILRNYDVVMSLLVLALIWLLLNRFPYAALAALTGLTAVVIYDGISYPINPLSIPFEPGGVAEKFLFISASFSLIIHKFRSRNNNAK